jgi:hypothetical protein
LVDQDLLLLASKTLWLLLGKPLEQLLLKNKEAIVFLIGLLVSSRPENNRELE